MKTIKFVGYLFYKYYSTGPRADICYFSAVCAMTILGYLHLFQLLLLLEIFNIIPVGTNGDLSRKITLLFGMLPLYCIMTGLFERKDIEPLREKYDYNWDKVFSGRVWLVIYFICSFALTVGLAYWKSKP
jgi:hypothetical protein